MKPGDFLFGVLDFFAVLLPGALATWLVLQYVPAKQLAAALTVDATLASQGLQPWATGLAFLLACYILGHFVFMVGSFADIGYGRVLHHIRGSDLAFKQADALRSRDFPPIGGSEAPRGKPVPTTLQWARAYLLLHAPVTRIEIDRLEADSKFFRSMMVLTPLAALHFAWFGPIGVAAVCLVLFALSALRYMERRWKMTQLTYVTAVLINRKVGGGGDPPRAEPASDD